MRVPRFRSIVWMLGAQFQYGLSVSSVKVVRHNFGEYFLGGLWKKLRLGSDNKNDLDGCKPNETASMFEAVLVLTRFRKSGNVPSVRVPLAFQG